MVDILTRILSNPATNYILSFGGLGILIMLALASLHKNFTMSERSWGLVTLGTGAIGGLFCQAVGWVTLPGSHAVCYGLAAFVGAMTAAAACGFSVVDLRATIVKPKE